MIDLLPYLTNSQNEGVEVTLTATVGDHFLNEIIVGYSTARIYNATIKIRFFGGSPQIFKPGMPLDLNLVASYHDGSPLQPYQLANSRIELRGDLDMRSFGRKSIELYPNISADNNAIWSIRVRNKCLLTRNHCLIILSRTWQTKFFYFFILFF